MCRVVSLVEKQSLYIQYLAYWVEQIKDADLREEVKRVLNGAPNYFWVKGYYHKEAPADEKGSNGMLRRIAKDCYYAKAILFTWGLGEYLDQTLSATLLHDCVKFGLDEQPVERKFHGPFTAEWISRGLGNMSFPMKEVLEVIRRHDGRAWVKNDVPEMAEMGALEKYDMLALAVHTADMVSSRQATVFQWT